MSSVDAVREIVNYLNQTTFIEGRTGVPDPFGNDVRGPLYIRDDAIHATYAGLQLATLFQPIIPVRAPLCEQSPTTTHEALLTLANPTDGSIHLHSEQRDFAQIPFDDAGIVYFDRLARTLHTLNFLAQSGVGDLHLNVHPNHILAVRADHGHVFERILQQCGLGPEQIVLEIAEHTLSDKQQLRAAVAAWQSRGYRIAIDHFNVQRAQLSRVLALNPAFIKIAGADLSGGGFVSDAKAQLQTTVSRIHAAGVKVIFIEGDSDACRDLARQVEFDAVQRVQQAPARQIQTTSDPYLRQPAAAIQPDAAVASAGAGDRGTDRRWEWCKASAPG